MLKEINTLIAEGRLPLAPLDQNGLSVNPTMSGVLFLLADEKNRACRFYVNAAPLSDFVKTNPELLLELLALTGPACDYADLRLGVDMRGRFLWVSTTVPYEALDETALLARCEAFKRDAARLSADVIAAINRAAERETLAAGAFSGSAAFAAGAFGVAGAAGAAVAASADEAPERAAAAQSPTADDSTAPLEDLGFPSGILWG